MVNGRLREREELLDRKRRLFKGAPLVKTGTQATDGDGGAKARAAAKAAAAAKAKAAREKAAAAAAAAGGPAVPK